MKSRRLLLLLASALGCLGASGTIGACANDEGSGRLGPEPIDMVVPAVDAAADAALSDAQQGTCADDCEYFPADCTPEVLCAGGPFDTTDPSVGMDWRTQINVIRGRSPDDVWVAGAAGAMAHFDGTSWTPSDLGVDESQRVLWLADSAEIAFGSRDRIYTRGLDSDAGAVSPGGWSILGPLNPPKGGGTRLTGSWAAPGSKLLWLATETDLWRVKLTDGSMLQSLPGIPSTVCTNIPCRRMRSIHGASDKTLWAVGEVGAAIRIADADGDTPTATPLNTLSWVGLAGVWAAADDDVWAVGGSGTIRHYTGDPLVWEVVPDIPTNQNLNAVHGASPNDVWAVGDAGVVLHYDGTTWARVKVAGLGARRPDLHTVWSPAPGHVWIGGQGVVLSLGGKP